MREHDQADEYLETLYHLRERHQPDLSSLREHLPELREETLARLVEEGLLARQGERLDLTGPGFQRAESIIRRHRLAERLLSDVLHLSAAEVEAAACEFEHMVAEEITESICILLGHPRSCPHGSPIPEGPCCREHARHYLSAALPLLEVPVGTWARVAYLGSHADDRQGRLTEFGVIPGALIKLHQLRPSIVVMLEERRLAMEERVAREIFVWRRWQEETGPAPRPVKRSWLKFWSR